MAYYPDVHPGDDVENSAERENDIRHLLNRSGEFRDGVNRAKRTTVRIPVWNLTPYPISAGALVYVVVTSDMCGEAFPVAPLDYNPYDPQFSFDDAPFGILETSLQPKDTGSLVMSGPVEVEIVSGTTGNFAKPVPTGGFERGLEGFRILHLNSAGTSAFVLVGDYRMPDFTAGYGISPTLLSGGTISTTYVQGTNITITPVVVEGVETGELSISCTASGGGGIGYPDYVALAGGTASNSLGEFTDDDYEEGVTDITGSTVPDDPLIGVSYILPVPADAPIKYYASADCLVRFAPDGPGETHFRFDIPESLEWTPNVAGHLRISVLDDGTHSGDCIRIYIGGEDYSDALPLYKCSAFQIQRLVGDETTIHVENGTISYIGGGGGDGWIPDWGTYNHTAVIKPNASSAYTAAQAGELWACACFDPFKDGFRYRHYSAHVSVNGACFKVAELILGNDDLYLKTPYGMMGITTQFDRYTNNDYTNKISVELWDPAEYKYVTLTYTRQYSEDYQDPDSGDYTYFGWYCYNAPRDEEDDEYDYRTIYTDKWHITGTEDVYLKKYDSNDDPYFDDFGYCSPVPDYTYFAWKSGSDYVFTSRSDNTVKPGTDVYEPDERGQFEAISGSTISSTNVCDIAAVGIGAGTPVRFRKNASISFVVTADGYGYYVSPASSSIPSAFCVVYEQPAPAAEEED